MKFTHYRGDFIFACSSHVYNLRPRPHDDSGRDAVAVAARRAAYIYMVSRPAPFDSMHRNAPLPAVFVTEA